MFFVNFLHNYQPQRICFQLGLFNFYWYGLLIAAAMIIGFWLTLKLAEKKDIKKEVVIDLVLYLMIFGFLGARIYHVLSEFSYYSANPWEILKVWQGGLGIFGAILAGLAVLFLYGRKAKISFLTLADLFTPALILGQAISRWGNWFNQELYGKPTNLPWGIPIGLDNRLIGFEDYQYFHPVFLYESIWNFLVFIVLIFLTKKPCKSGLIFALYLILYSFSRFFIEFLKIDSQPMFFSLRLGQVVAVLMFVTGWIILLGIKNHEAGNRNRE